MCWLNKQDNFYNSGSNHFLPAPLNFGGYPDYLTRTATQAGPQPPAQVTDVLLSNLSVTDFDIAYTLPPGPVDGVLLDISLTGDFSTFVPGYEALDIGLVNPFPATGLLQATTYFVRLRAYNGVGSGPNSATVSALTLPDQVTGTLSTSITDTSFTAAWDELPGVITGYRLDVSTSIDFSTFVPGYEALEVAGGSHAVIGLAPETLYHWRVRAYNGTGEGANSDPVTAETLAPATPRPLDDIGNDHVSLSLRLLRNAYTGPCIQLRRSTDDATADFGFDITGLVDIATIADWLGGATGYVTRWYCQNESGIFFEQTDATKQFIFIPDRGDGLPELAQGGTRKFLSGPPELYHPNNITLNIAGILRAYSPFGIGSWSSSLSLFSYFNYPNLGVVINGTAINSGVNISALTQRVFSLLYSENNVSVFDNNVNTYESLDEHGNMNVPDTTIQVGQTEAAWGSSDASFNELIMLNGETGTTNLLTLATSMQSFWNA